MLDDLHEGVKWAGDIAKLIAALLGIKKFLEKPKPEETDENKDKGKQDKP